jgi:hypothetical protein
MQAELELVRQVAPIAGAAHPRITGDIFRIIENTPRLMMLYEAIGGMRNNSDIGKAVKSFYGLTNDGNRRENNPISSLIKSHQIFMQAHTIIIGLHNRVGLRLSPNPTYTSIEIK